jgi:N6-L-threonylcarbamoyladenine synthase
VAWHDVDALAVTYGPGLASSLLVGMSTAKALALRLDCPLYAMNHLEAHVYSVFLDDDAPRVQDAVPFVALIVSGGHTCLVRVDAIGEYRLLGQTIDDAAGEAFDKGANLLGLGYPGGPAVEKAAREGDTRAVRFPRGRQRKDKWAFKHLDPELSFSFSGLKTALLYHLKEQPVREGDARFASVAASYQEAIVDALAQRCEKALHGFGCLAVVGGVSLNGRLRQRVTELTRRMGKRLLLAPRRYCADNAAMIAGLACVGQGITGAAAFRVDASPNLPIGDGLD